MSGNRILVTGGAGFIGSHLVRALLQRGDAVTVYDDLSVGRPENLPAGTNLRVGDIGDLDALRRALDGHRTLVHLAARVAIRSSFDFAVDDTRTNVVGTATVMRAAALSGSVERAVATSSMAVYADSPAALPITEDHPTWPLSPYGISKLALEQLVHRMGAAAGMCTSVLRLFNTYGPGQALSPYVGVVTIFANALCAGNRPRIFGDGKQCRDFVHVADVVQALLRTIDALGSPDAAGGATFNIGTGVPTSVNQLYALVSKALGIATVPAHEPAVAGELRYSIADIGRARASLGFEPVHQLEASLPQVVRELAGR